MFEIHHSGVSSFKQKCSIIGTEFSHWIFTIKNKSSFLQDILPCKNNIAIPKANKNKQKYV